MMLVISSGDQEGPQPPLEQAVSAGRSYTLTVKLPMSLLVARRAVGRTHIAGNTIP
jgi:hypothetical protein